MSEEIKILEKRKILVYLNTPYHVETALSIYKTLLLNNFDPFILLDYKDEHQREFGLKNFLDKFKINYIESNSFDLNSKKYFYKTILITGCVTHANAIEIGPPNYDSLLQFFKDEKMLIIFHYANYKKFHEAWSQYFTNHQSISVCKFSEKFNLDYISQTENIITDHVKLKKNFNKDKIRAVVIGRYDLIYNRNISYIESLLNTDTLLNKKICISILGECRGKFEQFSFIKSKNYTNIDIEYNFNLSEIDFYKEINNSDFIINTIDFTNRSYFYERFSSNFQHIISFEKPNFSFFPLTSIYLIPAIEFRHHRELESLFLKNINQIDELKYNFMCNKFEAVQNSARAHNKFIINKYFS